MPISPSPAPAAPLPTKPAAAESHPLGDFHEPSKGHLSGDFLEGIEFTDISARVTRDDLGAVEWESAVGHASTLGRGAPWWVGDLLVFAGKRYGETYAAARRATGYSEGHLKNLKRTALAFSVEDRDLRLGWDVHKMLVALRPEERGGWLVQAAEGGWTARELDEHLAAAEAEAHGEGPGSEPPSPPEVHDEMPCTHCGGTGVEPQVAS